MRKLFTFLTMVFLCSVANAQVISFTADDVAAAGTLDGKTFENGGLKIEITDVDGKVAIDQNNCYFGTADASTKYSHRMKSGGKSVVADDGTYKNALTLTIPYDGTLNICVRSGSNSATDRNLVLTQNDESLFDEVVQEEGGYTEVTFDGADKATNVYKVISVPVKAGTVTATYPTGALNFYSFELVAPTSYDVDITSAPESSYYSGGMDISAAALAGALGLEDEAALEALLTGNQAWYIKTADGMSNATTGNTGENAFWMNEQGAPQTFGTEGSAWFVGIYWHAADEEAGTAAYVDVHAGQKAGYFSDIETNKELSQVFYLVCGDKTITFNVKLTVTPPETFKLSSLNIVKEYELAIPFVTGKQNEGKTATITLDGLYDALGVTAEEFDANILTNAYAEVTKSTTENDVTSYTLSGNLMNMQDIRSMTDGWFGRYTNWDEASGIESTLEINAPMSWGTNCTLFIQDVTLADGELSFITGQYPGAFKKNSTDYTYIYIVNGTTAARLKVTIEMSDPETYPLDELEKAGETTVAVKMNPMDSYSTKAFDIDVAAIAETFGCSPEDLDASNIYSWASEGQMSDDHTEGGGSGFYFTSDSYIGSWTNSLETTAAYYVHFASIPEGKFEIGQYPNYFKIEEGGPDIQLNPDLIFVYGKYYYIVHIDYTITNDVLVDPSTWTRTYAMAYDVQLIDAEGYDQDKVCQTTLDMDDIAEAIGTSDPKLYTELWKANDDGTESMIYSDAYSCTPYPGFWMTGDGRSAGSWGDSPSYGMSYASNGVITYYCIAGAHNAGDEYMSRFYLVNEETGKYAQITLNVAFVNERGVAVGELGSTDVKVYLTDEAINDDTACYEGDEGVNWEEVFTALGITADEIPDCTWMITNQNGKLVDVSTDTSFEGENIMFDADGYMVDDPAEAVFTIGFNNDTNKFMISTLGDDPQEGVVYATKVALKNENGFYAFNVQAGISFEQSLKGDVNGDGKVDISDVVAIINQMAGTAEWPNANVNGDEKVDISDVVMVINIMAGQQ